ncbi:MAG: hypothetical protein HF973_06530 [Chloroflexi bacterium]|nr:hypothetical protein [Chloroflexota bacterium]
MSEQKQAWQAKLRRLGVVKGARHLKPELLPSPAHRSPPTDYRPPITDHRSPTTDYRSPITDTPQPIEKLLPGMRLEETAEGACYILDKVYPLAYRHGADRLADLLAFGADTAVPLTGDARFASLDFRNFLFLDTETTGLAGAGTIAFMVGAAFFEGDALVVRQFFLRDHGDEAAMLLLLDDLLAARDGLVTFNGRTFDVPLLDGRFLMNRLPSDIRQRPHLDLLPPSRRLWRARLGSVALGALEPALLGVRRTQEDVPGWMIPGLYHQYLRSGDGRELARVFYHNQIDMLSMVTLAARILRQFHQPDGADHPIDLYSLGKWQADLGLAEAAERHLRQAAQGDLPLELFHKNLYRLGWLLKRQDRRAEAVSIWQQIAATSFGDVAAHVELAKFYEWHERDITQAILWTERALALTADEMVRAELAHRLARLQRKTEPRISADSGD